MNKPVSHSVFESRIEILPPARKLPVPVAQYAADRDRRRRIYEDALLFCAIFLSVLMLSASAAVGLVLFALKLAQ